MIDYSSRRNYKNLRIGCFRAVLAWEDNIVNTTFYLHREKDHVFDIFITLPGLDLAYNKI